MRLLDELGVGTTIWPMPVEIPGAIPFTDDRAHASYDAEPSGGSGCARRDGAGASRSSAPASSASRARCTCSGVPSTSPTRGSPGERRPPHPGGAPNCGPHVMWEAYSHEVSSCGYWPGPPGEEGVFYAYAYPGAARLPRTARSACGARWDDDLGEFVLPYELVRTARDPDAASARVPAVHLRSGCRRPAEWDRDALERPNGAHRPWLTPAPTSTPPRMSRLPATAARTACASAAGGCTCGCACTAATSAAATTPLIATPPPTGTTTPTIRSSAVRTGRELVVVLPR